MFEQPLTSRSTDWPLLRGLRSLSPVYRSQPPLRKEAWTMEQHIGTLWSHSWAAEWRKVTSNLAVETTQDWWWKVEHYLAEEASGRPCNGERAERYLACASLMPRVTWQKCSTHRNLRLTDISSARRNEPLNWISNAWKVYYAECTHNMIFRGKPNLKFILL